LGYRENTPFLFSTTSGTRPKFSETLFATQPVSADKARMIFLRRDESPVGGPTVRLYIDGARTGELKNKGFLVVDAVPGEREIAAEARGEPGRFVLKINLESRQTYYLQASRREEYHQYIGVGAMFGVVGGLIAGALTDDDNGMYKIEPIEPAQALKLLEDLKLSE